MENIHTIGSISSIIAIVISAMVFISKQIRKYKEINRKQQKKYDKFRQNINSLAKSATTSAKRQDVFMYAYAALEYGRHHEVRLKLAAICWNIVYFITLILFAYSEVFSNFNQILFSILIFFFGILIFVMNRDHKQIAEANDSFAEGYMEAVVVHVYKIKNIK